MTPDFFDDLEQHLDRAAQRQARWGRLAATPRPSGGAVMAVALVAIVVAAGAFALPRVAGDDTELPAAAPTPTAVDGWTEYAPLNCAEHNRRPPVYADGDLPSALTERLALMRSADERKELPESLWGPELWGVYRDRATMFEVIDGTKVWAIPVADNPRRSKEGKDPCEPADERPAAEREPAVCVLWEGDEGEGLGCLRVDDIAEGRGLLGFFTGRRHVYLGFAPDGVRTVTFGGETTGVVSNHFVFRTDKRVDKPLEVDFDQPDEAPTADPGAPDDYGCDGPVHEETIEAFAVLRDNQPGERRYQAPDGITFLSGPVLAREAFGQKIWLIPAATPPNCGEPLICLATDMGGRESVSCHALPKEGESTPLDTRVDFSEGDGKPNLMFFAAVRDGFDGGVLTVDGERLELDARDNVVIAGGRWPEPEARAMAERFGTKIVRR